MVRLHKLLLPTLLVGLLIIGFSKPVTGQIGPPTLSVDPLSITTDVSTEFSIDISLIDIPETNMMTAAYIKVTWIRSAMERVGFPVTNEPSGWTATSNAAPWPPPDPLIDWIEFDLFPDDGAYVTEDRLWITLTFHCLEPGITEILVEGTADITTGTAAPVTFPLDPVIVTVNQGGHAVGGISTPINKLEIIAPYIALAGLIIAVSSVYVIKKRKD